MKNSGALSSDFAGTTPLRFNILGCSIEVECKQPHLAEPLKQIYRAFRDDSQSADADALPTCRLSYRITQAPEPNAAIVVLRDDHVELRASSMGEYLFLFEKDMTIELQKMFKHLYFMHAAVLSYRDEAIIIAAPSGTGKSTTAWALLHHGCRYLSDELAPIDMNAMRVSAYPRALGLKGVPPIYPLPDNYIATEQTLHLPVDSMPTDYLNGTLPIAAMFILEFHPELGAAVIERVSSSSAAMHIYANTLNALAHPDKGLEGAVSIATHTPCFHIKSTPDLAQSCQSLLEIVENLKH